MGQDTSSPYDMLAAAYISPKKRLGTVASNVVLAKPFLRASASQLA